MERWISVIGGFAVAAAISTLAGCNPNEPSGSASGAWQARSIGHSSYFELALEQIGDRVSGVACATSDGVLLFSDARVEGRYPDVRFVITPDAARPCCQHMIGGAFSGRIDDTRDIVGRFGAIDLRFERAASGRCEGAIQ